MLGGCGWFTPPDPPHPEPDELFEIVASQPVAAGQVVIAHGSGVEVVVAKAMQPDMSVSAATSGTSTIVAWVAGSARSGQQVQVGFVYPADNANPEVANARAYASSDGADIGGSLSFTASAALVSDKAPLSLTGLDHEETSGVTLSSHFANYRLGDVNADGTVNALDALRILDVADGQSGSSHQLYHSDLDGDYVTDASDVQRALDKAVDPQLPGLLVVKPSALSFVQLDPDGAGEAVVLVGNGGNQELTGLGWSETAVSVTEEGGIAGQSAALAIGAPPERGWVPEKLVVSDSEGGSATVRLGNLVILVGGQSNASGRGAPLNGWPETPHDGVRMLGNDYRWKNAYEPLDYWGGQLDMVSYDGAATYSFGTYLGNLLHDSLGYRTYLIPAALGGSPVLSWRPNGVTNRSTLFGSANFRALVSAGRAENPGSNQHPAEGGPVNVIVWHQGESENLASERSNFKAYTNEVMSAFDAQLGAHVVYAQLGSHFCDVPGSSREACQTSVGSEQLNVHYHAIAELQRQLERDGLSMVVTYDLPRSDRHHLSAYGQRVFAERLELAIREHVFGEDIDGTGPRLQGISYSGATITVSVDMPLEVGPLDRAFFTVWDGAPTGSIDDIAGGYYDGVTSISSAVVPEAAPDTVVITLSAATSGTPYVRYKVPEGVLPGTEEPSCPGTVCETLQQDVVRSQESGLPLPVFGPLAAAD